MNTPDRLAREFSRILRDVLTAAEMSEVIARNSAETSPRVCHSHDYCDANMVMLAACERLGVDGLSDDAGIALWNNAWEVAVANKFDGSP